MTAVFAPVREAHRLWLLTAPQLTLPVDEITGSNPGGEPNGRLNSHLASEQLLPGCVPTSTTNNNGPAATPSRERGRASQERL